MSESIILAAQQLRLSANEFRKLDKAQGERVLMDIENKFVEGNPRVWWLSLVNTCETTRACDDLSHLNDDLIPDSDWYYFIPEVSTKSVFVASLKAIKAVLGECEFMEYYILPSNLNWLFCENEHSECKICRI